MDVLVVGLGFAGATVARSLADEGWRVHAIDRRLHLAGNAFDELDDAGVRVHRYGPHAFHTSSSRVVDHLSRFTEWHPYEHRVRVSLAGRLLPFPVNRETINLVTGLDLDSAGAARWLEQARQSRDPILTSEDLVLSSVGPEFCDLFFRGYTRKHWGLELSDLSVGVAARIPVRTNDDDRYFDDTFQAMPRDGYVRLFERMLSHPLLSWELGREFPCGEAEALAAAKQGDGALAARDGDFRPRFRHLVYTGPLDAFFDHRHGHLPYRSVRFEHLHVADVERVQPVAQINHPNEHGYYRVTEFKHMTGQEHSGTSLVREYSMAEGEPFYPIPRWENEAIARRYREQAATIENATFVGRLAQYRYYNMDQVVAAALAAAQKVDERLRRGTGC